MSKSTRNGNNNSSATAESPRYFNEYGSGIGYLNGIREFGAEGKPTRYSAQISVLQGPEESVHYEYHDLTVSSKFVLSAIMKHKEAIDAEDSKVLIRFKMTNPRANAFIYKNGDRAGELGSSIGGFLTRILTMKVGGELVFEDDRTFDDQEES